MIAAILENRIVVCPDQELKKELDEWLYWKTRKATFPCYVEFVPLPKKTAGGKSNGKGSNGAVKAEQSNDESGLFQNGKMAERRGISPRITS